MEANISEKQKPDMDNAVEAMEANSNEKQKPDMDNAVVTVRSMRDVPPAHYTLKLSTFSLFLTAKIEKYESGVFEAGGYKWKLSLYPNGNKKKNANSHISLYLAIAETETLPSGWEVHVNFKLFVFNQTRDKYLTIQDAEGGIRRFHLMKTEWGFDQLIPLSTFNDATNGYLIDDCCVFGAEVFVIKPNGKGESASLVKDPVNNVYTWRMDNFSALDQHLVKSEDFTVGGHKWRLWIYPKGYSSSSRGKSLALFLELADCETLTSGRKVFTECKLRIRDEVNGNHLEREVCNWFCGSGETWGYREFMDLSNLKNASKGFMVNDVVTVEAQITLVSSVKDF